MCIAKKAVCVDGVLSSAFMYSLYFDIPLGFQASLVLIFDSISPLCRQHSCAIEVKSLPVVFFLSFDLNTVQFSGAGRNTSFDTNDDFTGYRLAKEREVDCKCC